MVQHKAHYLRELLPLRAAPKRKVQLRLWWSIRRVDCFQVKPGCGECWIQWTVLYVVGYIVDAVVDNLLLAKIDCIGEKIETTGSTPHLCSPAVAKQIQQQLCCSYEHQGGKWKLVPRWVTIGSVGDGGQ